MLKKSDYDALMRIQPQDVHKPYDFFQDSNPVTDQTEILLYHAFAMPEYKQGPLDWVSEKPQHQKLLRLARITCRCQLKIRNPPFPVRVPNKIWAGFVCYACRE